MRMPKVKKTVFDFEAVKVLETVLKPEETRVEAFSFPTPGRFKTFDVEAILSYAPVTGPAAFLQRIEAESSKGAQDPVCSSHSNREIQRERSGRRNSWSGVEPEMGETAEKRDGEPLRLRSAEWRLTCKQLFGDDTGAWRLHLEDLNARSLWRDGSRSVASW